MSKQDWERSHRRYQLVTQLTESPELVSEELAADLVAEYGTWENVVRAVHQRWVTLVNGCLDVELEIGAYTSGADALNRAVRRAIAHSPALHRTLGVLREDPLLAVLDERFHLRLAQSVGIAHPYSGFRESIQEVRRILARAAAVELGTRSRRRGWRTRTPLRWSRSAGLANV